MEATAKISTPPYGALDLGSNSFRLLIGFVDGKDIQPLVKKLRTVRLAGGLRESGILSREAVNSGIEALRDFRRQLDAHGVVNYTCCGTEALRRAENSHEFIAAAESILGCGIEVLTGSREAELSTSGVLAGRGNSISSPTLIADVGGGSTEVSFVSENDTLQGSISLPAGAVALSADNAVYNADTFALVRERLGEFKAKIPDSPRASLVCTGGTATTIAMLDLDLETYNEQKVHGHIIETKALDRLTSDLSRLSANDRNRLPGLEYGRGEIIVAGCKIYQEIIATIGVEGMIVSDWGLLEGILLDGNK